MYVKWIVNYITGECDLRVRALIRNVRGLQVKRMSVL